MIISHSKKAIFLETAKTGSMSMSKLLRSSGFFVKGIDERFGQHTLISQAIEQNVITKEQAQEYDVYAVVRNPFERVISAWNHDSSGKDNPEFITKENFNREILYGDFIQSWILREPQTYMFEDAYNVQPLLYEQYDKEMQRVFDKHDVIMPHIPKINVRRSGADRVTPSMVMTEESRRFIKHKYRKDFALWNKTNLEKIA